MWGLTQGRVEDTRGLGRGPAPFAGAPKMGGGRLGRRVGEGLLGRCRARDSELPDAVCVFTWKASGV